MPCHGSRIAVSLVVASTVAGLLSVPACKRQAASTASNAASPAPAATESAPAAEPSKSAGTGGEPPAPPPREASPGVETAAPTAAVSAVSTAVASAPSALQLSGLTFTVPVGWMAQSVTPGIMAPKAVFHLPKVADDTADAQVRITHFPNMKGMDDANIDRWLAIMKTPAGEPISRDDASLAKSQHNGVQLTVLDLTGTLSGRMGGGGPGIEGQRLIAAIVDHPNGPHFVKVTGGTDTMAKWADSILAFLDSATVTGG